MTRSYSYKMLIGLLTGLLVLSLTGVAILILLLERLKSFAHAHEFVEKLIKEQQKAQQEQRERFDQHQIHTLKLIQDSLTQGMTDVRNQMLATLKQHTETLDKSVEKLTQATQERLREISGQVDKRLNEGFEKTTQTFTDVVKRLAIIDEAQKKITELSGNVVNLQEILTDKRARGAFGEVQLSALIHNMLPETHYALQYTLSNGKRADCILFLPSPTGNVVIDAKFPLESYRLLHDPNISEHDRRQVEQQFRLDIRKHIQDIAEKYIIPNETAEGAVMFIPAEGVFSEIHAHYPDLIEIAQRARVWLASPTTMMAIITTARAVLKDDATRQQIHIIQEHLLALGKDFERFQKRMDNLSRHIDQAHEDVEQVHRSSQKITQRFRQIEKVELRTSTEVDTALLEPSDSP